MVEELVNAGVEVHLVVSEGGRKIMEHETVCTFSELKKTVSAWYGNSDLFAGPASGSFALEGMVIVPCSMKTLSAVANGYGDTLSSRAASCCLKERRKLILVVRETPLDLPSLRNMVAVCESGAVVLPAMPGFYHKPRKIDELVDFIVGKVFDQFGIPHSLFSRWE
jgi:4-hydroxy-3-polyprenylbenzoate decarboxylase